MSTTRSDRMPILFIGHGSPMNAIDDNQWSQGFRRLATELPRPRAVLAISAHWYGPGTWLTANDHPPTIHDFGGFPPALHQMQYPAPGDVDLASQIVRLLGERAALSHDWGLDHGTWTVLHYLLPAADCPVVQLSIDHRLSAAEHVAIGHKLASLRDEGVLILGSGNVTHNLRHAFTSYQQGHHDTPPWASRFDADVAQAIEQHDGDYLARSLSSDDGRMAHPSPDHYLPLLYTIGAADAHDPVSFPIEGFDMASLSMRSVRWG